MTEQDLTHLRQKINDLAEQDSRNSSANLGPDRAETGDAMNALRDRDLFGFIPVSILRSALPHEIGRIGSTPHNDRLPRHVPIYVDNLWEWGRPDRFPKGPGGIARVARRAAGHRRATRLRDPGSRIPLRSATAPGDDLLEHDDAGRGRDLDAGGSVRGVLLYDWARVRAGTPRSPVNAVTVLLEWHRR